MVPISVDATNMIALNVPARGRDPAHNTARCAATDDGGAKALPGVEDPGSGSRRVPQRELK